MLIVSAHLCARVCTYPTIVMMFEFRCRLLPTLSGKHLFEQSCVAEKEFDHYRTKYSLSTKSIQLLTWNLILLLTDNSFLLLQAQSVDAEGILIELNLCRFHCFDNFLDPDLNIGTGSLIGFPSTDTLQTSSSIFLMG